MFNDVIVAYRNGAPVRLRDVATVEETQENNRAGRVGEHDPGGDPERPAPARRQRHRRGRPHQAAAAAPRSTLPPSLDVAVLTDRTLTIRASVHDVQIELAFAVGLVVR